MASVVAARSQAVVACAVIGSEVVGVLPSSRAWSRSHAVVIQPTAGLEPIYVSKQLLVRGAESDPLNCEVQALQLPQPTAGWSGGLGLRRRVPGVEVGAAVALVVGARNGTSFLRRRTRPDQHARSPDHGYGRSRKLSHYERCSP